MSLEQACFNCERCFFLADNCINEEITYQKLERKKNELQIIPNGYMVKRNISREQLGDNLEKNPEFRREVAMENDQVYQARNDAARPLWEVIKSGFFMAKARNALKACKQCDYLEPRIVKVIDEEKAY